MNYSVSNINVAYMTDYTFCTGFFLISVIYVGEIVVGIQKWRFRINKNSALLEN